jgi:uncharacterized protein DUF3568
MPVRSLLIIGATALLVLPLSGCIAVAAAGCAGAGVAYAKGDTVDTVDGSPVEVAAAAEAALTGMGMVVTRNTSSAVDSDVVARTGQDRKIEVEAKAGANGASTVSVRVGTWGDDALQHQILDQIRMNVAAGRAGGAPPSSND